MPKVAYSEEERERVREALIITGLELMSTQGIQHTTVEQIYKKVGISRTFFYTFFPTKEELIVEALYLQQPNLIAYAQTLRNDPALSWRASLTKLFYALCDGEKHGIIILTMEEQQLLFKRLTPRSYRMFREKQFRLFETLLQIWEIKVDIEQLKLILNLSILLVVTSRVFPDTVPLLISEVSEKTVALQLEMLINYLEQLRPEI